MLSQYGMRPILMAAWHGHKDAVQVLVNAGACTNSVNKVRILHITYLPYSIYIDRFLVKCFPSLVNSRIIFIFKLFDN